VLVADACQRGYCLPATFSQILTRIERNLVEAPSPALAPKAARRLPA
jgi:hypothetical protein